MEAAGRARGLAPQDMISDILVMDSAHTMRPRGVRLVPRSLFCMHACGTVSYRSDANFPLKPPALICETRF